MTVFWDVGQCNVVETNWHVLTASIIKQYVPLKCQSISTRLHGATFEKTVSHLHTHCCEILKY
jgi:hypothetical protein